MIYLLPIADCRFGLLTIDRLQKAVRAIELRSLYSISIEVGPEVEPDGAAVVVERGLR